ncbi:MAG: hypothetical protein WAK10_07705, partial [Methanoregula sp.]
DSYTNTMVINLINITSTNLMAKEGIGTVQMSLVGEPYYNETIFPANDLRLPLTLEYNNSHPVQDYSVAWDNYFTKTLNIQPVLPITGSTRKYILLPFSTTTEYKLVIKIFNVNIKSI